MSQNPPDRTATSFEAPGSLVPPGLIGRIVRLLSGIWLLSGLWSLIQFGWSTMVDTSVPGNWQWWAFAALAFWFLPYVVNIGFTRDWRRRPQQVVAGLFAVAVVIDLVGWSTWWAPPAGLVMYGLLAYFSVHLGVSFVLSGLLATPGCEMRSIPHLWTILTRRETKEHFCPGMLDRLDRWEARQLPTRPGDDPNS